MHVARGARSVNHVNGRTGLVLDDWFARDLVGLYEPWQAAVLPAPRLLALNDDVAETLGLDPGWLRSDDGIAALTGQTVPDGARPVAQGYAGHQFGGYSPRLGDGRALLLGEVVTADGRHLDLHLKGSGRTPFARGGDGKAAVGPMLRELVISEAMHALGIPTTRALAVVATGESIARESMLPGAVLTRVASSHLRVGTFQYASSLRDADVLRRLVSHAITRHYPHAADAPVPALALFDGVVTAQARLVAQWMLVGFVHGVMNTDNMTISGETIDYGPCAFMDGYDPATVFSSIDHGGRYAWGNQPNIGQWDLARLAEALLPLVDADDTVAVERVTGVLHTFPTRFEQCWRDGMRAKLGLAAASIDADAGDLLVDDLLSLLQTHRVDYTSAFRALAAALRDHGDRLTDLFDGPLARQALDAWVTRWRLAVDTGPTSATAVADEMDAVNPVYVPRNHVVEAALGAATDGDLRPLDALLDAVRRPFAERDGLEQFARPAPIGSGRYVTFCGT